MQNYTESPPGYGGLVHNAFNQRKTRFKFVEISIAVVENQNFVYSDGNPPKNFLKLVEKYDGVPYPTIELTSATL